jgi:hypothetical protein
MYVCMYVCMYVRMYVRTYVCMYVRMYVYYATPVWPSEGHGMTNVNKGTQHQISRQQRNTQTRGPLSAIAAIRSSKPHNTAKTANTVLCQIPHTLPTKVLCKKKSDRFSPCDECCAKNQSIWFMTDLFSMSPSVWLLQYESFSMGPSVWVRQYGSFSMGL